MTFSRADLGVGALRFTLILVLSLPYLIWLRLIPSWSAPDPAWLPVVGRGLAQAAASTAGAFALGWILFRGLRALAAERRAAGELRLLMPNAVPPLFLALALISLVTPFPFGFGAVVTAHVLLNAGLVAVALERLERARLDALAEAAWVMGVRESTFWTRLAWPVVRRDLAPLAFFVYGLSFTGFSLPLLLQGPRQLSIEVLIYDLIRRDGRWDQAVLLALIELVTLLTLSCVLPRAEAGAVAPEPRTLPYRARRGWGLVTWAPAAILAAGLLGGLAHARWPDDVGAVAAATLTSLALGATVGLLNLILFTLAALAYGGRWFGRALLGFLAPSPAVTGFALLLAWPRPPGEVGQLVRLAAALTLLYFAPLYRWQVHAALEGLREQRRVARTLGAGRLQIWREVVWPQAAPAMLAASGLAAAWATGEFALSGLLLDHAVTLPQLISAHVAHYQWGEAQALLVPLALAAGVPYVLYGRLAAYVRS